jgi:Sigma-70 factor, region 1.1
MASNIKATPQEEEVPEKQAPETAPDRPLLDLSDAAVKKLIRTAKKRGYVTHDQINSMLSSEEVNSEQIEDVLAMFSEMGVMACTRFRRHRVRCFDGAGGGSWRDGSLPASSSLRRCA